MSGIERFDIDLLDCAILRAAPGDLVIVRANCPITPAVAESIRSGLRERLPDGVNVQIVMLDEALSIELVSAL